MGLPGANLAINVDLKRNNAAVQSKLSLPAVKTLLSFKDSTSDLQDVTGKTANVSSYS